MKKNNINIKAGILAAAAVFAATFSLASCQKNDNSMSMDAPSGQSSLVVSLTDGPLSKASGDQTSNDVTIKNAQVFIFNRRNGQIDNAEYKSFTATTGSCTMSALTCSFGEKEVWAIVNAPKDYVSEGTIKTLDDLKATTVTLAQNSLDALIMTGNAQKSLTQGTETMTVNVERLVAAVVLKSVRNEFAVPSYQDKLTITGAYLMNVPGVQRLDGGILASGSDSPSSSWYAFYRKAVDPDPTTLLTESISETGIAYQSAHESLHTFYTFANNHNKVEGSDDKTAKSSSYLVVECKVDGVQCVYPVLLPEIERNQRYEVSLTVKHVGGDPEKPWDKIEFAAFTPSISIAAWGAPVSVPETI